MVFHGVDFHYLSTGETPLIHAARQGHTSTAKYLLECGANPAIPSDLGATALHHSAGIGVLFNFQSLFSCLDFLVHGELVPKFAVSHNPSIFLV